MALSIPGSFGGTAYEEHDLVVLITAGVTLLSLVVQGIALPHVVRWANARPTAVQRREAEELDEETRVLAGIMRDIVEELPSMAQRIGVEDGELVNAIRESYGRREERMLQAASEEEFSFFDEDETALRLECIDFARARVLEARNAGRLDGATASLAIKRLDTEGALLAVNLGDDADTVGAIYGQLAGAFHGRQGIPESWRDKLHAAGLIEDLAAGIADRVGSFTIAPVAAI